MMVSHSHIEPAVLGRMRLPVFIGLLITLIALAPLFGGRLPSAYAAAIIVDSTSNDLIAGDGLCTLREAIHNANADADTTSGDCLAGIGSDTIELGAGLTYTLEVVDNSVDGNNGLPLIVSEMTINGNGSTIQRSAVAPDFRIVYVDDIGTLSINGLTITGGVASGAGTAGRGGGIFNCGGTLNVTDSTINGNTANTEGGGISHCMGDLVMTDSVISDNVAGTEGGGLFNCNATAIITGSNIDNNTSTGDGGGVFNDVNALLTIVDSTLDGNRGARGGAIFNTGNSTVTVNDSIISRNTASDEGGGIGSETGMVEITNTTVDGNSAHIMGGGIGNRMGLLSIADSTVTNNTAIGTIASDGGGIFSANGLTVITRSTISGNTARRFGGGICNFQSIMTLMDSTISNNRAGSFGGGIGNNSDLTISNVTISGNQAINEGGGIGNEGTVSLTNTTVSGNTAATGAGIFNATIGTVEAINTIAAGNITGDDCSGVITSLGNNLSGDTSCGFGEPTDQSGIDPLLGALQDNGGPTETRALLSGSPAIDTGDNLVCPAADQRGFPRPRDGDDNGSADCDVGSYEFGLAVASPAPGIAGELNTFNVSGATPGATVFFIGGLSAGPTNVPGCPEQTIDIGSPKSLGTAIGDANGNANINIAIPSAAAGRTVRIQVVEPSNCLVSNLVVHQFE